MVVKEVHGLSLNNAKKVTEYPYENIDIHESEDGFRYVVYKHKQREEGFDLKESQSRENPEKYLKGYQLDKLRWRGETWKQKS